MDLPSMVQRAGDKLIVRSVVSGNQLYADQRNNSNVNLNEKSNTSNMLTNSNVLEQELQRYAQEQFIQQQQHQQQQQQQQQAAANLAAAVAHQQQQQQHVKQPQSLPMQHPVLELKEEGLPQCKIKRNYSCNYCTYFTQNPRFHLTHLRDVHGEKIVINKCKLCLYASRHFQKLVRHMKMVHGCTDGIPGGHGQARGKRGMSREMRKRKLEQSVGLDDDNTNLPTTVGSSMSNVTDMTTLEQFKRELEIQEQKLEREKQAFNKQQKEQMHQQQMAVGAVLAAAYNRQREQGMRNVLEQQEGGINDTAHQFSAITSSRTVKNEASSSHSGSTSPAESGVRNSPPIEERPHCRLLKCSVCDFTTLYRTQLHEHEIEEHQKTKFFRCEKCSYVTHIKARFSKHVKYHSMPMIKCVTCDFRTPYKWNLDRHMKNHGGTGPFKCVACDFTADIKQSLTVHEMNHHVPPVGHAAGMALMGRRRVNKVGATDICDDFLSDSADLDDQYNNNHIDDFDDGLVGLSESSAPFVKKFKYNDEEPTDLSQKGGSDSSSIHQDMPSTQGLNLAKVKR